MRSSIPGFGPTISLSMNPTVVKQHITPTRRLHNTDDGRDGSAGMSGGPPFPAH